MIDQMGEQGLEPFRPYPIEHGRGFNRVDFKKICRSDLAAGAAQQGQPCKVRGQSVGDTGMTGRICGFASVAAKDQTGQLEKR